MGAPVTPDALFAHPRLAEVYDEVDGERDDLDAYLAVVDELGARSVLAAGFEVDEVREAPDRPGLEMVFVTHRPG